MSRLSIAGCVLFCLSSPLFAQEEGESPEEIQAKIEEQFDQRDKNGDAMLDEKEMEGFSQRLLGRMRERGLRQGYPLPREEFVTAGVAERTEERERDRERDDDRRMQKEQKQDEATPTATTEPPRSAPTSSRRNTSSKGLFPVLPAEYQTRDKNGDGQIGFYEWDRSQRAEFLKLDKNGDGFLTPAELLGKSFAGATNSRGGGSSATQDAVDKEARDTFSRMDADRDGGIGEEEWGRSQRVRPMFEQAGVNVSLPMDEQSFLSNYRRVKAATGGERR